MYKKFVVYIIKHGRVYNLDDIVLSSLLLFCLLLILLSPFVLSCSLLSFSVSSSDSSSVLSYTMSRHECVLLLLLLLCVLLVLSSFALLCGGFSIINYCRRRSEESWAEITMFVMTGGIRPMGCTNPTYPTRQNEWCK